MEIFVSLIKYIFVVGVAVEGALILWSLVKLARDKAHAAQAPARPVEE